MGPSLQAEINRGITPRFCITRSPLGGPGPSAEPKRGGGMRWARVGGREGGREEKTFNAWTFTHTQRIGGSRGGESGVSLIPSKTEKLAINLFGSFSTRSPDCRLVLQHLVQNRPSSGSGGGRARENLPLLHCFLVHGRLVWFDVKSNH